MKSVSVSKWDLFSAFYHGKVRQVGFWWRLLAFESLKPWARVKHTPFGRGSKYLIHCTYISDEVLWTRSQRRSDTLNKKTGKRRNCSLCSEFRNTLFWLFCFSVFFLPVSTPSANLQMQSIALVLSQIDFRLCAPALRSPLFSFHWMFKTPFAAILQWPFCVLSSMQRRCL